MTARHRMEKMDRLEILMQEGTFRFHAYDYEQLNFEP